MINTYPSSLLCFPKDPIGEVKRLLDFSPLAEIRPRNLEERLLCLSAQLDGFFKRQRPPLDFDPFTAAMKEKINGHLASARKSLKRLGFKLPAYERFGVG